MFSDVTLPVPAQWGTFDVESFASYRARWPAKYGHIPNEVIETWIYRHWRDFQEWLPLKPLDWRFALVEMTSEQLLTVSHVGDWMETLTFWGDDLLDGPTRSKTWLGRYMIEHGTSPSPIIVAENAKGWTHPREFGNPEFEQPLQLIEGHMRLAYLQAMIRRECKALLPVHTVVLATLP